MQHGVSCSFATGIYGLRRATDHFLYPAKLAFCEIPRVAGARVAGLLHGSLFHRFHIFLYFHVRVHFSKRFSSRAEHPADDLSFISLALALCHGRMDHKFHSRNRLRPKSPARRMGCLSDLWQMVLAQVFYHRAIRFSLLSAFFILRFRAFPAVMVFWRQ